MVFDKNVFINCPFDASYLNDLLKPMLYILIRNGLKTRLSLEISDSGQARLEKIIDLIMSCKYSIHDLSILKSRKVDEFARMNMPFELGIDYGLRNSSIPKLIQKRFLILGAEQYDYMRDASDLNGIDIKVHENDTKTIFVCRYKWCSETLKMQNQDPPLKFFDDFMDVLSELYIKKLNELGKDEYAMSFLEHVSIPEFIEKIKHRVL